MTEVTERKKVSRQATSLQFLKGITLFSKLSEKDVECFASVSHLKTVKKGRLLYLEGDPADFVYVICRGWLKLFHITEEGEEVILAMLTSDSTTGENSIFEQGRYTCSAQVAEDATVISIPYRIIKEQLQVNNQLALNMLGTMVQYQRRHDVQLEQYLLYSAPQRIGCFLLGLCPVLEQKDGVVLNLPYDKALIASILGMKGATFSRALNILREETGIDITGTRVTIDSIDKLLNFVNGCYSHYRIPGF
jgi:CRP/FNR family transcriptional regulator